MSRPSYLGDLKLLMQGSGMQLGMALLLTAFSSALDLVCISLLPAFVGWALASGTNPAEAMPLSLPLLGFAQPSLTSTTVIVVALFALRAVVTILVGAYLSHLSQAIRERCASSIVLGCLRAPYAQTLRHSVAEGITAATTHASQFANAVVLPLLRLVVDLMTIFVLLAFLAWYSPQLTAAVALVLAATGVAYALLVRRSSQTHSRRMVALEEEFGGNVSQALQGSREVRIYQAQDYFAGEISRSLRGLKHSQARLGAIYWLPRALGELVLILMAIAYMVVTVRGGISQSIVLSNLSALAFAGMRLLPAFAQSMVGVAMLRAGQAVTTALAEDIRRTDLVAADTVAGSSPVSTESIDSLELCDVGFAYADSAPVLDGANLKILKGQSVGVIGRSGAGKSTLGDLVLGLLDPVGGSVLVNGRSCSLNQSWWWDRVGFVPQNPFIANDTLARNVAYGVSDLAIDRTRLGEALQLAQLQPLVERWPQGVDTPLGESGVRLSGGQRQRVAIARALYRNREFLVLDEATSALDEETEKEVIQALTALRGKVTMLAIAHRPSTLKACDFIVEIRDGKLLVVAQHPQPDAENLG